MRILEVIRNEETLLKWLSTKTTNLVKSEDMFERFDAVSDTSVIEVKIRKHHYDMQLIEKSKFNAIKEEAFVRGLKPIYIVADYNGVWRYNLNEIEEPIWDTKDLPIVTSFTNKGNKLKDIGLLHISQGIKIL